MRLLWTALGLVLAAGLARAAEAVDLAPPVLVLAGGKALLRFDDFSWFEEGAPEGRVPAS